MTKQAHFNLEGKNQSIFNSTKMLLVYSLILLNKINTIHLEICIASLICDTTIQIGWTPYALLSIRQKNRR